MRPSWTLSTPSHLPVPRDSLGGEEYEASVKEDQGENDEESVAHSPKVGIVEHLTSLGRAAKRNRFRTKNPWKVVDQTRGNPLLGDKKLWGEQVIEVRLYLQIYVERTKNRESGRNKTQSISSPGRLEHGASVPESLEKAGSHIQMSQTGIRTSCPRETKRKWAVRCWDTKEGKLRVHLPERLRG